MRDIKFRAYSKQYNRVLHFGDRVNKLEMNTLLFDRTRLQNDKIENYWSFGWRDYDWAVINGAYSYNKEDKLMQYIGLKDIDNKEIYESDYIVIPNQYPFYENGKLIYVGEVQWIYSQWQCVLKLVDKTRRGISDGINCGINDDGFDENSKTYYKVVGNKYEGLMEG